MVSATVIEIIAVVLFIVVIGGTLQLMGYVHNKQSGGANTKNMYVIFFMGALVFALYTYIIGNS
jgi:hypothetical protein